MLWPVTFMGLAAGYAVASIPGALLGAVLGHLLDRRLRLQGWADLRERLGGRTALRDDELMFVMLGRLAKIDGPVQPAHIAQAQHEMKRLGMDADAQRRAIEAFNRGKRGTDRLQGHLRRLGKQKHAAEGLLRACWRMAWADGKARDAERALILEWGMWLGWSSMQVRALSTKYEPKAERSRQHKARPERAVPVNPNAVYHDALRLLGVSEQTELPLVKRAYRRLLSRHHPDKLTGSGASAAQVRDATEKTRELHQAYQLIRERRESR